LLNFRPFSALLVQIRVKIRPQNYRVAPLLIRPNNRPVGNTDPLLLMAATCETVLSGGPAQVTVAACDLVM
jgi:hypothetical protein